MPRKKKPTKEMILEELEEMVYQAKQDLNMEDWRIDVKYDPDLEEQDTNGSIAEITYSRHKEAYVTVFDYGGVGTMYPVIVHELSHCIIGPVVDAYKEMIMTQRVIIDHFLEEMEERAVDDLANIVHKLKRGQE